MQNTSLPPARKILNLPAGYFSMVLGIIGMGLSWRYAATVWPVPRLPGELLTGFATSLWLLLALAFSWRILRYPQTVRAEIDDPFKSSFVSLFPATTMLVAIGVLPWLRLLSVGLFVVGAVGQLAYGAWQSAGLWRGQHPLEATTPGLYLPTVASNFISAMACGALGWSVLGSLFLGAGVLSWLSLEPAILQRMRSAGEMPEAVRPVTGIQLAPALVACNALLSVNGGVADMFTHMLFGYGLLQLLFMVRLIPWYWHPPFTVSFWSFSFGLSALSTTALHLEHADPDGIFHWLAAPLFIFSNAMVGLLIIRTVILLTQGKLLVRESLPLLLNHKDIS